MTKAKSEKLCKYIKLMCLDMDKSCICCVAKEAYGQGKKDFAKEVLKELESEVKLCSFLNTYEATSVIDFIVRYKTRLEQKLKEMEK